MAKPWVAKQLSKTKPPPFVPAAVKVGSTVCFAGTMGVDFGMFSDWTLWHVCASREDAIDLLPILAKSATAFTTLTTEEIEQHKAICKRGQEWLEANVT